MISAYLAQAEMYQFTSIALPALGAGTPEYSVELATDVMHIAISTFALLDPIHLKTVRIILNQQHMVSCYTDVFARPMSPAEQLEVTELKPRQSLIPRACNAIASHLFRSGTGTKTTTSNPSSTGIHSSVEIPTVTAYSELMMVVFADDIKKVEKTEAYLQQLIENQIFIDKIDDTLISKLTSSQKADIKRKAKDRNVDIAIELGKLQHNIQLKGDLGDIFKLNHTLMQF